MIFYKTPDEIELIRKSCLLVTDTLAHVASLLKPGITGAQLDRAAEEFIRSHGAIPGFKGYNGFVGTLCISPNETVVHGIPSDQAFKEGDIVSIDCGVIMNEFYGDAAYTFAIGEVDEDTLRLMQVTRDCLHLAIDQVQVGNRIGDIGHAVQQEAEKVNGYGVVRTLVGHGIGRSLHEAPEVPNFGRKGRGVMLKEGLVIAIEPMINLGTKNVRLMKDGWTINTRDKKPSVHFEHSVAATKEGPDVLSNHDVVDDAVKNNQELTLVPAKKAIFALRNFEHG